MGPGRDPPPPCPVGWSASSVISPLSKATRAENWGCPASRFHTPFRRLVLRALLLTAIVEELEYQQPVCCQDPIAFQIQATHQDSLRQVFGPDPAGL